jgi:hypothetical protein
LYNNNVNNKDDANIQISADVLNLLVIRNNPDEDLEGLTDQLRADWLAAGTARPDPGFTVPDLAREVPAECADPALAEAASNLQTLAAETSDALAFEAYVQGVLDAACGTQHLAAIDGLDQALAAAGTVKDALLSSLYADFGGEDVPEDIYRQFQESNYVLAVQGGYSGDAPLNNDKPDVPADCEGAVQDYND